MATATVSVVEQLVNSISGMDAYGRDSAERTVELNSHVAAAANTCVNGIEDAAGFDIVLGQLKAEFEGGKAQTFDDALGYIVYRGMAEIKRQRDAATAAKAKSKLSEIQKLYKSMLAINPALIADPKFVEKMVTALGM